MEQYKILQPKEGVTIVTVLIPNEASAWKNESYHINTLWYKTDEMHYPKHIDLPEGNWQLLGKATDIPEEVWQGIVEPEVRILSWPVNTDMPEVEELTATESAMSFLEANEVYRVNPYGEKEQEDISDLGAFTVMMRKRHRLWKQAEDNTGTWVILMKQND